MNEPVKDPSGTPTEQPVVETPESKDDTVKYETYRKTLSEAKRAKERLAELEREKAERDAADKEAEEQRLKDEQKWKEYAEKKEAEANEWKTKFDTTTSQIVDAKKLDAFLNTLDGKVDRKFWNFIDTDAIMTNPETGEIDDMSVAKTVESFKANYPELIVYPGQKTGLPSESPKPATGSLTYDEWRKLPAKEMKTRYHEMRETEKRLNN